MRHNILNTYNEAEDPEMYASAQKLLRQLEELGYTFDYGLDGIPTELRELKPLWYIEAFTTYRGKVKESLINIEESGYNTKEEAEAKSLKATTPSTRLNA